MLIAIHQKRQNMGQLLHQFYLQNQIELLFDVRNFFSLYSIKLKSFLEHHNRVKRHTTNSNNTNALRAFTHSHENSKHCLTTTGKVKNKEQQPSIGTSNENKNRKNRLKKKFNFILMEVTVISTPPHMIFLNINFVNKISEKSKPRILVKQIKYSFFKTRTYR